MILMRFVPMTIDLWKEVSEKMLPTPAKFHYVFSLRDVSQVVLLSEVLSA